MWKGLLCATEGYILQLYYIASAEVININTLIDSNVHGSALSGEEVESQRTTKQRMQYCSLNSKF